MARYSIHEGTKVGDLTHTQITSLTAFLSSPATSPRPTNTSLMNPFPQSSPETSSPILSAILSKHPPPGARAQGQTVEDLSDLKIESELRREILENIGHQRTVGSYIGRRHAMGLPVRGQNTRSNAKTARKLNRVDRRA